MIRSLAIGCLLFLAGIICLAQQEHASAYWQSRDSNYNSNCATGGTCTGGGGTTTFDPSHTSPNITLSNGNLTATLSGSTGDFNTWSIGCHTTGKYYAEFTVGATIGDEGGVGLANTSETNANYLGSSNNSIAIYAMSGKVYMGGTSSISYSSFSTSGNVVQVAVDLGASKIWWQTNTAGWNASTLINQNPATDTGGFSISVITGTVCAAVNLGSADGNSITANFGGSAYAFTPPSGYGHF